MTPSEDIHKLMARAIMQKRFSAKWWIYIAMAWGVLVLVSISRRPSEIRAHVKEHTITTYHTEHVHKVTIVSAYFPFEVAKHSQEEYRHHLQNFFGSVDAPVFLYTIPAMVPFFEEMRKGMTHKIHYETYPDIWHVPLAAQFKKVLQSQHSIDPENFRHSPELYAVWDSKAWFLWHASKLNPFHSQHFFWVDAGCFRDVHTLRNWPDVSRVQSVFERYPDRMLFTAVDNTFWNGDGHVYRREDGPITTPDIIQGTFFGGPPQAIDWFYHTLVDYMEDYANRGLFVGKDQNVFNIIIATHPKQVMILDSTHPESVCGDRWFYFRYFLAHPSEKPALCTYQPLHTLEPVGRFHA